MTSEVYDSPSRNPREAGYSWTMRLLGLAYLVGAVVFFFFPGALFYALNVGARFISAVEAIPDPSERFWTASASSSAIMVSLVFFLAAGYPRSHSFPWLILVSRVVSAGAFAYLFAYDHKYFAYLIAMGVDSLVFSVVLLAWIWVSTGVKSNPTSGALS